MGCGVSKPETEEGGEDQGSNDKESEVADSLTFDQEISTHSKITDGEKIGKEKKDDQLKDGEEKGNEIKISPESPSFRIYCVFPQDPNDDTVVDDLPQNKYISNDNKEQKRRRQEAVGMRIRKRFNNVKKLLTPPTPTPPSSSTS